VALALRAKAPALKANPLYAKFYATIRKIPRGRVATYGQIAILAGYPRNARLVGTALRNLRDDSVPWHRVVNSRGEISRRSRADDDEFQRILLEAEGITFDLEGRLDLRQFGWRPRGSRYPSPQPRSSPP
jgi:methylated-DNA-protein-cysteine methyltransferase related protein